MHAFNMFFFYILEVGFQFVYLTTSMVLNITEGRKKSHFDPKHLVYMSVVLVVGF